MKENWDDKEFVLKKLKENGCYLDRASARLQDDDQVVSVAVSENSLSLEYASERLRDNKEIVLTAVRKNNDSAMYASARLLDDHDVAFLYVQSCRWRLERLGPKMRDNYSVVMAAVSHWGTALAHASARLKDDETIVSAATTRPRCCGFKYASERLRGSYHMLSLAFENEGFHAAFVFATEPLQKNFHRLRVFWLRWKAVEKRPTHCVQTVHCVHCVQTVHYVQTAHYVHQWLPLELIEHITNLVLQKSK